MGRDFIAFNRRKTIIVEPRDDHRFEAFAILVEMIAHDLLASARHAGRDRIRFISALPRCT